MMKNKFTLILLFFSTLLFSQNSVFWKVTKDGNEGYILGTYHFLGRNFLTENKIILEKLKNSNIALSENIDSAKVFINIRKENENLKKLNKLEFETIKKIVPSYVDVNKMSFRELIVIIDGKITTKFCLTEKEKTDTLKMDDYLKKYSIDNEIKLLGLEQTKQTFELINNNLYSGFVEDKLLNILKSKIIFLNSDKQNINCSIVSEYRTNKHLFNFSRESQEKMITLRNKNWIDKIDKTIQENKKAFIFVGLYHLDFKDGILELLKNKGYNIEEIQLN